MANRKDGKKVFTDINEILDIVMDVESGAEYDIGDSDFDSEDEQQTVNDNLFAEEEQSSSDQEQNNLEPLTESNNAQSTPLPGTSKSHFETPFHDEELSNDELESDKENTGAESTTTPAAAPQPVSQRQTRSTKHGGKAKRCLQEIQSSVVQVVQVQVVIQVVQEACIQASFSGCIECTQSVL